MRTCLFVVLLFLVKLTIAQNDEKIKPGTPINSGFVFIDGKYIEPPYKFSYKKGNVYINGIEASTTPEMKKHFQKGKKKYIEPIFKLDKNIGWFEYLSMINPLTGNKYHTDYMNYLYTKYPNTSREQFEKFIRDLPFVKSYDNGYLITYNGETHKYFLTYRSSAIKSQRNKIEKENMQFYEKALAQGGTIIYFKDNLPSINRLDTLETICLLEDLYKNTDSINWYYLTDKYIYNQSIPKEYMIDLLQNIKNNQKLKQRFENVKKNYYKLKNGVNEKKTNETPLQKNKSSTSFAPKENSVTYFCPYTFDGSFSGYNQIIDVFQDKLSGYNYSVSYYVDNTDNNCLDFSLDALKNVSSGIVCLDAHGTSNYGGQIELFYSIDMSACDLLMQNQANLGLGQTTFPGDTNIYWVVLAGQEWFANNWKNRLTQNNSLVFVLACEGAVLLEAYGGSAAFAYLNTTNTAQNISDLNTILKKMNGESNSGSYRTAWDAFVNSSFNNLTIRSNSPLTLCPAPLSKSPDNGETVGLQGDGWFETDTYCDATVPISELDPNHSPIAFEWTNPGLSITNVQWDDPDGDGLSNKIMYHWESTVNNTVTVKVNHNYWQSAPSVNSQYHLLDYDKAIPNSEDGQYSFNISNTIPTQSPFADFSYTVSGNTAYFQDQSTNTPTSWQWSFGDGQNSTSQNVQHSYSSTGTYSVTLTATNTFGSSSKTKSVSITSTPQTVTVSGVVQNFDNFVPIAGATVSCPYGSTTTNANGYYSLQVPFNSSDCGNITASAPGFQSSSTCSCNNLISDKSCDFNLSEYSAVEIKCTSNTDNQICNGYTSAFEAVYQNITAINHNWYIDGIYKDHTNFSNIWQTTLDVGVGSHIVRVEVETDNGDIFYDELGVNVSNCAGTECYYNNIMIQQSCEVVNIGTTVHYYEIFPLNEICKDEVKRDWVIGFGAPDEKIFAKKSFNEVEHYDVDYAFSVAGPKTIALRYYEKNFWGNYNNIFHDVWTGISVINCNYDSYYLPPSYDFFTMAVFNDSYNPARLYGGRNVYINGKANNYLNREDINVFACNEIVLDGDIEFIANGNHELILENYNSPCINNNLLVNKNDSTQNEVNDHFSFSVFPNPFKSNINILINNALYSEIIIEINDILGKMVLFTKEKISRGEHLFSFNTELLMPGTYIIKMLSNEFSKSIKIIKQ